MRTLILAALATSLALAPLSCSGDKAGLVLIYPDSAAQSRVDSLSLYILRPQGEDLCAELTDPDSPLSPNSGGLIRERVIRDESPQNIASSNVSDLSTGTRVFLVEGYETGDLFLRGCTEAKLADGKNRIEVALAYTDGSGADGGVPDGGTDGMPDASGAPRLLRVTVNDLQDPGRAFEGIRVQATDGFDTVAALTDADGRATLDVDSLGSPLTVTAAGQIGGTPDYRTASTVVGVTPEFGGADNLASMRIGLDIGDPSPPPAGSITGTISNIPGGDTVTVYARTPFLPPNLFNDVADGSDNYAITGLPVNETYSLLAISDDGAANVVAARATLSVADATPVDLDFDLATDGAQVNVNASITPNTAAIGVNGSYSASVLLPRGPIAFEGPDNNPGSNFSVPSPELNASLLGQGASLLYHLEAVNAPVAGEANLAFSTTTPAPTPNLTLPTPPDIDAPSNFAMIAASAAEALQIDISSLFANHELVEIVLRATISGVEHRWHLILPADSTAITLPSLPASFDIIAPGTFEIDVMPMSVADSFVYGVDVASNFADYTQAFDVPQRSRRRITITVTN